MRIAALPAQTLDLIARYRWDRIIEKHEGPESWASVLRFHNPEFLEVMGHWVLLPINCSHHTQITVLRATPSADGQSLTLFLKDTTFVHEPAEEWFGAGFLAVCDRVPGEEFYLAVVYHEWFIIEPPSIAVS